VIHKRDETEILAMTPAREWLVTLRIQVARASVGFALLLGLLGSVMTFVPGYQADWFGVAAAGALTGILSPTRWMRVLALALAVCLAALAWDGYLQGRRYRELQRHWVEIADPPLAPSRLPP
jgi:hypothetical protein